MRWSVLSWPGLVFGGSKRPVGGLPMWSEQSEATTINMPVDGLSPPEFAASQLAPPLPHENFAIRVRDVSKVYLIYDRPQDRLKQMIVPPLLRFAGGKAKAYHREFAALRQVSFDIKRGETVGI